MDSVFVLASSVEAEPVSWLWEQRIPLAAFSIVEGEPGCNKSTLLFDLAARVSSGGEMPNCTDSAPPGGVLLISDEDAQMTIRRSLEANDADVDRVFIYDKKLAAKRPIILPSGAELLKSEIDRTRARLVVLDPFSSRIEGSISSEKSLRAAISALTAVAEHTGAAIVGIRHLTKNNSGSTLHRGIGGIALIGFARSCLLVAVDPGNNEHRVVAHVKSNLGPLATSLSFKPVPQAGGLHVEWLGPCSYSAEQVLSSASSEGSAVHEAAYVLYSVLGKGPVWADEAKRLVLRAGVTGRTLRRAKQLLMVKSKRDGFGKRSRIYWKLPETSDLIRHLRKRDMNELSDALFHGQTDRPPDEPGDDFAGCLEDLGNGANIDPADSWKRGGRADKDNEKDVVEDPDGEEERDPADWWKRGEKKDDEEENG